MPRPVVLAIDDDVGVTRALTDDLSRRFGEDFRVIGEPSASAGLAILRDLAGSADPVALLIADHDMAEMSGIDFLARAHEMHPLAKRVLPGPGGRSHRQHRGAAGTQVTDGHGQDHTHHDGRSTAHHSRSRRPCPAFCRRGCPLPLDQAGRFRSRRRCDSDTPHPRVPGRRGTAGNDCLIAASSAHWSRTVRITARPSHVRWAM
jgi:CheY-like chemotaxis protein